MSSFEYILHLRPHHGLCLQNFRGHGYSDAFSKNMAEAVTLLEENPGQMIEIMKGCDDLCAACPNRIENAEKAIAEHEEGVASISTCKSGKPDLFDENVLVRTGLHYGDVISWKEFSDKTKELSLDHLDETCPDCQWLSLCKEIAADRKTITIRHAEMSDVEALAAVEAACFPVAEAATPAEIRERVEVYGDHFWILEKDGRVISFVDGFVTDIRDLTDEMYEKASMHDAGSAWQMLFGVNTMPEARKKGYAGLLIRRLIAQARVEGRKGVVLTCKDKLVKYYSTFGFEDEGVSESTHGNVVWHQMRLTF